MQRKDQPDRPFLLTPGPVSVPEETLRALARPTVFHRSAEFQKLFSRVRSKLRTVLRAPDEYEIVLLSGSGTLANETVLSSVLGPEDQVLVLSNGDFGERLGKMLEVHGITCRRFEQPWASPFYLEDVDRVLDDPAITAVAMVALETSTGMVNPVREIGRKCREAGQIFIVDAISALGAEDLDVYRDRIDFCTSVPNKGLEGPPGLSFVCANPSALHRRRDAKPRSFYLNLYQYLGFAAEEQTPTTPAGPAIVALETALDRLVAEGLPERRSRYLKFSQFLRLKARQLGIDTLLEDSHHSATAITTLCLPCGVSAEGMHSFMSQNGVTVWQPHSLQDKIGFDAIQVSVMGAIGEPEVSYFIKLLSEYVNVESERSRS